MDSTDPQRKLAIKLTDVETAIKKRDFPQAKKLLVALKQSDDELPPHLEFRFLHASGLTLLHTGQAAAAVEELNRGLTIVPDDPVLLENLGVACLAIQEHEEAFTHLQAAVANSTPQPSLIVNLAMAALGLNKTELVDELISHALSLDSEHGQAWVLRGKRAFDKNLFEDAEQYVGRGLELLPSSPEGLSLQADLYLKRQDFQKAATAYEQLIKKYQRPTHYWNYAIALNHLGRPQDSIATNKKLLRDFIDGSLTLNHQSAPAAMSADLAHIALERLAFALNELGIAFFPVAGTFLGIHRDGRLLPKDKDLDVALPWSTPRKALVEGLETFGFITPSRQKVLEEETGRWAIAVLHMQTAVSIDLFFVKNEPKHFELGVDYTPPLRWRVRPFKLKPITFQGISLLAPDPADQYLSDFYGPDWKTPQHYCAVMRGHALTADSRLGGLAFGYNRLLALMWWGEWKKALAYVEQMLLVTNDPLVSDVRPLIRDQLPKEEIP